MKITFEENLNEKDFKELNNHFHFVSYLFNPKLDIPEYRRTTIDTDDLKNSLSWISFIESWLDKGFILSKENWEIYFKT